MTANTTQNTWLPDRTLDVLIVGLVVLGIVLLLLNGPFGPIRSLTLVTTVTTGIPVVVAVLGYVRVAEAVQTWEPVALALWGYVALQVAGILGFFLFADFSASYPGAMAEMIRHLTQFLLWTGLVTGLYAAVATRRHRPIQAVVLTALVPFVALPVYAVA